MPKYDIFWSPEGRIIATVQAKSAHAAKRKAPMPYRKYLGEIYVTLHTNSFRATIILKSEGFLLGGIRRHESSAFTNAEDARRWAEAATEINKARTGYENAVIITLIDPVYDPRPIL
jgi:hypothetical protein